MASAGDISSLKNLISRLKPGQPAKIVLDSLTRIRSEFIRRSDGVEEFRRLGGLKPLLYLISMPNERIVDVSLSILANCCLEAKTRKQVKQLQGIAHIVSILKALKQTSILNRASRTLANLAIDADIAEIIHQQGEVLTTLVSLLKNTRDDECRQSVIRALRHLSKTAKHREAVIEAEGIQPMAELLGSKHAGVVGASVRALSEVTKNCDLNCVRQVIEADAVSTLVDLATHARTVIRENAVLALFNLMAHGIMRPAVGSAGGIRAFINDVRRKTSTAPLSVQLLCVCAREAVNRVKIRELGGVALMVEMLRLDEYSTHHETIIASFLNFVYDDKSLETMLTNDVVTVLLIHLHKALGSDKRENSPDSNGDVSDSSASESRSKSQKTSSAVEMNPTKDECVQNEPACSGNEPSLCDEGKAGPSVKVSNLLLATPQCMRQVCTGFASGTSQETPNNPTTSRSFSPYLSPASDTSDAMAQYASPSYSYSPPYALSPRWSPQGSVFSMYSDSSEAGFQPEMSPIHQTEEPDDMFEEETHEAGPSGLPSAEPLLSAQDRQASDSDTSSDTGVTNRTSGDLPQNSEENSDSNRSSIFPDSDFANLRTAITKTNVECPEPKGLEYNILLFLSRLSQMENPSNILVTKDCLKSLLKYVVGTSNIGNRAVRILTRLIRNPLCFEHMVVNHAPSLIHILLAKSTNHVAGTPEGGTEGELSQEGKDDQAGCLKYAGPLLKNLSIQGETPYGQGVVAHLLLAGSHREQRSAAIAVPFIYRNSDLRKKMLLEYNAIGVLFAIIHSLPIHRTEEMLTMAVDALSRLAVDLGIASPSSERLPSLSRNRNETAAADEGVGVLSDVRTSRTLDSCLYCQQDCESDVHFAVGDGPRIAANRERVAAASAVFAAMLSGSYAESQQSVVAINEVPHQAFLFTVHYLHGCRLGNCRRMRQLVDGTEHLVLDVLAASDRFMLPEMLELVHDEVVAHHFDFSSIVPLYEYCCTYHCEKLQDECIQFILTEETDLSTRKAALKELSQCRSGDSAFNNILYLIERQL